MLCSDWAYDENMFGILVPFKECTGFNTVVIASFWWWPKKTLLWHWRLGPMCLTWDHGIFFLSWDTSNNSPKMTWRNFFKYPLNFQWNTFTTCLANQSGHRVCREAWLRLLGVGKNRLRRTKRRHRGQDERSMKCGSLEHFTFFCETCKRADSSVNIQVVVQHNTWTFAFGDLETKAPNPTCFQNPAFMFGPRISQTSCKSNGLREGFFHSCVLDSWWINDDKETWTNGSRLFVWNSKPAAP